MTTIDEHLCEELDVHFDPKWGSPFWLDRAESLSFDHWVWMEEARLNAAISPFIFDDEERACHK